jgi:hypothetical protein
MTTFEKNSNKHKYPPITVHNHGKKIPSHLALMEHIPT